MSITINYDGNVNSLSTRGFNLVLGIEILTVDHCFWAFWDTLYRVPSGSTVALKFSALIPGLQVV